MKPVVVLLIFAKWCSHCQEFKPTWDAFVKENAKHDKIEMREIEDVVLDAELAKLNSELFGGNGGEKIDGGRGFPTLVKVEGGKVSYYEEERRPEMVAKWIGNDVKIPVVSKGGGKRRKGMKTGKRGGCSGGCGKYSRRCGKKNRKTRRI